MNLQISTLPQVLYMLDPSASTGEVCNSPVSSYVPSSVLIGTGGLTGRIECQLVAPYLRTYVSGLRFKPPDWAIFTIPCGTSHNSTLLRVAQANIGADCSDEWFQAMWNGWLCLRCAPSYISWKWRPSVSFEHIRTRTDLRRLMNGVLLFSKGTYHSLVLVLVSC